MSIRHFVLLALLPVAAVACDRDVSGTTHSTPVVTDPFALFDPCTDIPVDFMDQRGLKLNDSFPPHDETVNGVKWYGCGWTMRDGYFVTITTTTLTLDLIDSRNFEGYQEFEAGGRAAVVYRRVPSYTDSCVADIALGSGTLDVSLTNPPSATATRDRDPCDLVRGLAIDLERLLPV